MITSLSVAVTLLGTGLLIAFPLVPAITELRRKSDAQPLSVLQQHAGEIRHFAESFRQYVATIEPVLQHCSESHTTARGSMRDGTPYLVLGRCDEEVFLPIKRQGNCQTLIAATTDLPLPAHVAFTQDIFAKGDIAGGPASQYRGVLSEKNVHLEASSTVLRWVHANGNFKAESGCQLLGRVSSDRSIQLASNCVFLRLNAPRVELGKRSDDGLATADELSHLQLQEPVPARRLHDGDLELHAGRVFHGNLIVRGELRIGDNAKILGSVKSEKDLLVGNHVAVSGSLMSERKLRIGRNCSIHGPVIAEREMLIQRGSRCGGEKSATTVSAPRIVAEEGVVVFGTVWARELGSVVAK